MERSEELLLKMMDYEKGCPQRITHFLKVLAFAKLLGAMAGIDDKTSLILDTAAIVHDIGIKRSLEKYGTACGKQQETEGPPLAEAMLESLGYEPEVVRRVSYLVANHHTYEDIQGLDYQILVEADFLVNIEGRQLSRRDLAEIRRDIFQTEAGRAVFDKLYPQGMAK
ncbi:MAG TPA: HD domain-containing protein [Firmicutes bacterium]|nr:HD domain-containing protein [Bacillota bacterium]